MCRWAYGGWVGEWWARRSEYQRGTLGWGQGAGQKPYWVFGLPLWRSYRTTHIYRQHGLPQLALQALQHVQMDVVEPECEPSVCTENGKPDGDCCAIRCRLCRPRRPSP